MPRRFNYVSGDWKDTVVKTDGPGAERVESCTTCHLAQECYDHLYFVAKAFRR